jgi:hypothetical protein
LGIAIENHDNSKFLESEFDGYRQWFFPEGNEVKDREYAKKRMEQSWLNHIHNNAHHWQHWCIPTKSKLIVVEMPKVYILEMLCDWKGMSYNENSLSIKDFYEKNIGNMCLHEKTIDNINTFIDFFV